MDDEPERQQKIARLLRSEHVKYQDIDLGAGEGTGGYRRTSMDELLFRGGLEGLSLLDIGSSLGHFCIQALKHGASAATGLETSPERIRHAREIAELVEPRARYEAADFEHWEAQAKSFDVVLCLNVLHHLYDPVAAIRKIMAIARNRFYLEVAPLTLREVVRVASPIGLWRASQAPLMLLGDTSDSRRAADRTFTFTKKALATIVNGHSKAYEPLLFHPSSFKGRWIAEGRRRQIDHLVVVAGVTGVGKSTFVERLRDRAFADRFGVEEGHSAISANRVDELAPGRHRTLVYHYDILRPFDRPLQSHGRDPAFHLLASAQRTTFITLANSGATLRERLAKADAGSGQAARKKARRRHKVISDQYGNPEFLAAWYDAWERAARIHAQPGDRHHLVRTDVDYPELSGPDALETLFRSSSRG